MKYARILQAIANQAWAMEPNKLSAMLDIIRYAAEGGRLTSDQIAENLRPYRGQLDAATEANVAQSYGSVAVMGLSGVISNRAPLVQDVSTDPGTNVDEFTAAFREALADEETKAIVIDTNSPGGAVGGVPELATEIFESRGEKPIIAHVNDLNASAAYWITSAADEIVATPSAEVGSIGVYTVHEDVSEMFEAAGIKHTFISAGEYKTEGNPLEPLGEEAREHIQSIVNDFYDMFVDAIARNRGVATADVRNGYGQGRVLTAQRALDAGMIDRVETLDETLARFNVGPKAEPRKQPAGKSRAMAARELDLLELEAK